MRIGFSPSGKDNDTFPAYAKHMQELEDAVELILANYRAGNTSFTLNFDDDISDSDVEWIQEQEEKRTQNRAQGVCQYCAGSFKGIFKKILIFALVGIGHILDTRIIGSGSVLRTAVIFFYLSNEGVSLLENAAHLGLPVPKKLKAVLEQLHDRAEKEDTAITETNDHPIEPEAPDEDDNYREDYDNAEDE